MDLDKEREGLARWMRKLTGAANEVKNRWARLRRLGKRQTAAKTAAVPDRALEEAGAMADALIARMGRADS